jgi:hypothetical protein
VSQCDDDTMDVRSYIILSANAPEAGLKQLPLPEHVEAVKAVSRGITGLERIYLEALHRNVSARRAFNVVQQSTPQPTPPRVHSQGTRLSEHLELLRLKKRSEELHIFQRYVTKLQHSPAAKPDFLGPKTIPRVQLDSLSPAQQYDSSDGGQAVDSVDALVRRLERAVISAKYKVEHEHALLNEVEREVSASSVIHTQKNRSCALAATRVELVAWIEDKISSSQSNEKSMVNKGGREQQTESTIPLLQAEIMAKYNQYIEMRKSLLDCISDCIAFAEHSQAEVAASEVKSNFPTPSAQTPSLSYLPFILTQIQNPTQLRHFHRQQAAYYSNLMAKEGSKTTFELSRLADESHLLPSYPMLARQDRFKHAATAIASKGLLANAAPSEEESEMSRRMKAWSFAADAAREATERMLVGQLEKGTEAVKEGESWVGKLRELHGDEVGVGQDEGGSGDGDSGQEDEDVWALEAAAGHLDGSKQAVKGTRCLWAGLRGDVGLKKGT